MALILAISVQMHGKRCREREVVVDSTVQAKNITHPVDTKQYRKIIQACWKLADDHGVKIRRRFGKEVRKRVIFAGTNPSGKKRMMTPPK